MEVIKRGRTTKETVGILKYGAASIRIPTKNKMAIQIFNNCYVIGHKGNTVFFEKGDSGSGVFLIDTNDEKLLPLGIAFAKLNSWKETFVCKIDTILQEFDVSVIEEGEELMETSETVIYHR
jgi:hypothetical protein